MKQVFSQFLAPLKPNRNSLLTSLLFVTFAAGNAAPVQDIDQSLVKAGFENVRVLDKQDTLLAAVEAHHIRGGYRIVGEALRIMAEAAPQRKCYQLLILENQQAQLAVSAQQNKDGWQATVGYDTEGIAQQLDKEKAPVQNSNTGKVDIYFQPIFEINNHRLDVLALAGLYVAPSVETTLWKGNRFYVQPIIPLINNFKKGNPDKVPQIGALGVRQEWYNNEKVRFSTSAGTFLYNSLGLQANFVYHLNQNLDWGIEAKYLHEQGFTTQGKWKVGNKAHISALAKLDYYHVPTALQCKLSAGTFQFGDWGLRADVVRHFGEHSTGLYFVFAEGEWNAGFNFAIPIAQKKRNLQSNKVRFYWPEYYTFEYSLVSSPKSRFEAERMGQNIKERPEQSFSAHYWQAAYLQHYLQRYLNDIIR